MTKKIDRLYTPEAVLRMKNFYQRHTILETAAEFHTSHETIRRILKLNNVRIRRKGEHTDETKIYTAASKCANTVRKYPKGLHRKILNKLTDIIF